jgi:hypothetical protein
MLIFKSSEAVILVASIRRQRVSGLGGDGRARAGL